MTQMHVVRLHQYGAAENLIYEEAQRPEPQPGEALVRVRAIGINPVDWKTREGRGVAEELDPPIILGWDIAGVIEEVGGGADQFAVGDEVFGMVRFPEFGNAYADYVAAPASELANKPANISFAEAAASPLVALTAWQALFDVAQLQAGQTLLVHAAAGGVGHVAVQLAKWRGARVIGTASARNADFLRGLGVDQVIDYTHERFEDIARDVDVVLDTQGEETQRRSFAILKPGGMLVSIAETPDKALAQLDFVNIMSYDKTGPWKPKKSGPHAPYKMAVKDVDYWTDKGIAKEKLNVGIPFYGYGFGPDAPESMSFRKIISTYAGSENRDEVDLPAGGTIYYNGIPTIKKKTKLALKKTGGIMIWQLLQDAQGDLSLLKVVNDTIDKKSK